MAEVLTAIDLTKLHISTTDAAAARNEAAWAWYASIGSPKLFVAPLVGYSEPAFRVLCRTLGAQCCSTPMIDAAGYAASPRYRAEYAFSGGAADRPLTAQLGGSDPAALARAAALVAATGHCDAVELNMGCPQRCAKKTGSGAFLMEDPARAVARIKAMRARAHNAGRPLAPKVACVVKIRCFDDVARTLALAAALERAGAEMLTVHGRTRHAGGGRRTAAQLANWDWIRAVKERAGIPVISNGNVRHAADVAACFEATGADGVMSGAVHAHLVGSSR
ncbi:tRNA dihydrouridine synthase [Aureococcus anophagefferens]|nr:tRNA dihydrouridine synthase [Aureococcus anophagefferens]